MEVSATQQMLKDVVKDALVEVINGNKQREDGEFGNLLTVMEDPATGNRHGVYYLLGEVVETEKYLDLIQYIDSMDAEDTLHLKINSEGGDVTTGIAIIQSMRTTGGFIVTEQMSIAGSISALMLMAGDSIVINDFGVTLFHTYSITVGGKRHELNALMAAENVRYKRAIKDLCSAVLTKRELKNIENGMDVWIQADDMNTRLHKISQQTDAVAQDVQVTSVRQELD